MTRAVKIYDELLDTLNLMDDASAGRLIKAALAYARFDDAAEAVEFLKTREENMVWFLLKGMIDRDQETQENPTKTHGENPSNNPSENPTETQAKTQRKAESARENGKKGGRPKTQETHGGNPTENPTENPTSSSSLPPSSPSSPFSASPSPDPNPNSVTPITPYSPPLTTTTTGDAGGGAEENEDLNDERPTRDAVVAYAVDNLLPMSANNLDELLSFKADLPVECITHAIDVALAQGKRSWSYVRAILNRYVTEGLKTLGEIKAQEDRRAAQTARSGTAINPTHNPALNYQQSEIRDSDLDGLFVNLDDVWNQYHGKESGDEGVSGV